MSSPLIERLSTESNYPLLDLENINDFTDSQEHSVLFFTEDAKRFPESNDVAVVLPELLKAFPKLSPAIVKQDDEKKIQKLYGFRSWPALVFLRQGDYLGCITGIQDWADYLAEIKEILASDPSRPPSIGIPVVSS